MISTEFPRTKYIRQLEESMKALDYTPTDFYEEIVKEQVSVLKSFISLNKNKNFNIVSIVEFSIILLFYLQNIYIYTYL